MCARGLSQENPSTKQPRRVSGVRSATGHLFVGVCLQPGDWIGAESGAALRVRSRVSVADGAGGGELPHAGGFSRGETERVGRTVHAGSGGARQAGNETW